MIFIGIAVTLLGYYYDSGPLYLLGGILLGAWAGQALWA